MTYSRDQHATHHEDVRFDLSAVSDCHQLEAASDVVQVLPDVSHVAVWSDTQSAHHLQSEHTQLNDRVFTAAKNHDNERRSRLYVLPKLQIKKFS